MNSVTRKKTDFKRCNHLSRPEFRHENSRQIIKAFVDLSRNYIFEKKNARRPNSRIIKYTLSKLGQESSFRVYANGLSEEQQKELFDQYQFVNREFLYDIHWYTDVENEYYMPERVILIGESELGDRRKGDKSGEKNPAIKFDFQKLLMGNAELRLMIFKTKSMAELGNLNYYFDKAINYYRNLQKGAVFLFLCFVHDTKELYYAEKYKR